MGFSQIFKLAIVAVLISSPFNYSLAQTTPSDSSCDTSALEAKIDAINAQTYTLSARVSSLESTTREEQNQTRSSITSTLIQLPIIFVNKLFTYLLLGIIDLDSGTGIFSVYKSLYVAKPDLTPLETPVTEISKILLSVYVLVIVIYSLQLLYSGAIGRAELKENIARILLGALFLRSSFWIYSILIDITTAITQLFVGYIDFNILSLSTKTVILNLDVITLFIVIFVILGLVCGAIVYIATLFGLLVFPLIVICLSMPFERIRAFGESLLSGIIGILLAPAISASVLAVIPYALQSSSSSFLLTRAVLLAGIILAIIVPLFVVLSLARKPIIKLAGVVKVVKKVV